MGLAALLAHQPRALGDPGLQLSFAAVAGLFVLAPPLAERARGWLPGRVADLAAMAAAARPGHGAGAVRGTSAASRWRAWR